MTIDNKSYPISEFRHYVIQQPEYCKIVAHVAFKRILEEV